MYVSSASATGHLTALHDRSKGIFLWMLEGLRRLIANCYHFTTSQRAKDNISSAVRNANNILDLLDSEGYVAFKADYEASTKNLYEAYKRWCEDNAENPLSPKSFANQLSQNAKNQSLFLYLIARLGIKIRNAQSMVVQMVKNTTISRTQIIIW